MTAVRAAVRAVLRINPGLRRFLGIGISLWNQISNFEGIGLVRTKRSHDAQQIIQCSNAIINDQSTASPQQVQIFFYPVIKTNLRRCMLIIKESRHG
jgi:hypothetical protein